MQVKLGYELITGNEVGIEPSHVFVCGMSQKSGKTTTIEAFVARSGKQAIVFKTKPGEKVFENSGNAIPAFFKERTDYEFIRALLESSSKERLNTEKTVLMELCQGITSLEDLKQSVDNTLVSGAKIRRDIYVRLQHYLDNLVPQLKKAKLSKYLVMHSGVNVMELQEFSEDIQALVIQSTLDEILKNHHDVIVVVPEAWRFVPEKRNAPCKMAIESFIRQGATNNNFVVMDSQDLAGIDKIPLKQVSCYLLGYQAEINEVKHTLNQIPLPAKSKPRVDEIMTLKIGQFFLATNEGVKKVYIQPLWLSDENAQQVAKGENLPNVLARNYSRLIAEKAMKDKISAGQRTGKSLVITEKLRKEKDSGFSIPAKFGVPKVIHEDSTPLYQDRSFFSEKSPTRVEFTSLRVELLNKIEELEMKIRSGMSPVYMVSPLEKIQKSFQEEAKNHILSQVGKLDDEQKKILLFVEAQGKGVTLTAIVDKCLHLSATSGGTRDKYSKKTKEMESLQVVRKDKNNVVYPNLKEFIRAYCGVHGVTEQEIQQVYEHVLAGVIG
jgi:hypothetical protein